MSVANVGGDRDRQRADQASVCSFAYPLCEPERVGASLDKVHLRSREHFLIMARLRSPRERTIFRSLARSLRPLSLVSPSESRLSRARRLRSGKFMVRQTREKRRDGFSVEIFAIPTHATRESVRLSPKVIRSFVQRSRRRRSSERSPIHSANARVLESQRRGVPAEFSIDREKRILRISSESERRAEEKKLHACGSHARDIVRVKHDVFHL